jgi:ribonuclease P protein component
VNKEFRLTRSNDFKRVRRFGKSYAHPLVVLYVITSTEEQARIGVTAGRWVGGAVDRNRAKRLLREAVRSLHHQILPGNDLLLIARGPLPSANLTTTLAALQALLKRANLISNL